MDLLPELLAEVTRRCDAMVDLRRDLHAHPELAFAEVRTTELVRHQLRQLDLTERTCPTPTGAVAVLEGGRPGRTVMLRADLDGLPVQEGVDLPFASVIDGTMHACGHDAHTAILLGVAGALGRYRSELPGRFVFVFQPAEEHIGGARAMLQGGLLEGLEQDGLRPEALIGLHVGSTLPLGLVAMRAGISMAGAQGLHISVTGSGGHGALNPRQGNVVLAASRLADRMHLCVEGLGAEGTDCVCSPGLLNAGTASNVVPTRAELAGTLRWFDESQRSLALGRLRRLAEEVTEEFSVQVVVQEMDAAPPVRNDPDVTASVLAATTAALPAVTVMSMPAPIAASDDVSELMDRVPGCYMLLGAGRADGTSGAHHSPTFAIDEGALAVGAAALVASALELAR
jgi:amidohydrolase